MKRKVLFLDIDGTLVDFHGNIPESAVRALRGAKSRGHRLVLCTGRTRVQICPWLQEFGFDGMITGAGAQVEAGDKLLSRRLIPRERLKKAVDFFESICAPYYLQAAGGIFCPEWCMERRTSVFRGEVTEDERKKQFGMLTRDDRPYLRTDVQKLAYYQSAEPLDEVRRALGDYFTVEASSFQLTRSFDGEVTIRGIDKAYGMRIYLEHEGIGREDAAALGDGPNDLGMLKYAGVGVAMGNAGDSLKAEADLVTAPVDRDGLYRAFEMLNVL